MNKWEHISNLGKTIHKGLDDIWDRKLKKDASVIVGDVWSEFVLSSSNMLNEAQSHLDVKIDEKSGTLACLLNLPDNHPEYDSHNKPFSDYVLGNINQSSKYILQGIKNPYAHRLLQERFLNYKSQIASQLAKYEANIVMDKRHNMAIENIEKLSKSTYANPELFLSNKEDALIAINSLDIDQIHKAKLAKQATSSIAESAARSVLTHLPSSIIDPNIKYPWKDDLDVRTLARFQMQAQNSVVNEQNRNLREFNQLSKIHFDSILNHGRGIDGIDDKVTTLPLSFVEEFTQREKLHYKAYDTLEQIKYMPLSDGMNIISKLLPKSDSSNYNEEMGLYNKLYQTLEKQVRLAKKDPAKFVETLFTEELESSNSLGNRISTRLELQRQKGIPQYLQKMLTNEERESFRASLDSRDANVISDSLNNILAIESDYNSLGHQIIEEILQDKNLSALSHFYIESSIYNRGNVARDIARSMAAGQSLGEMSNEDEKNIRDEIQTSIKDWRDSTLSGNAENAIEIQIMQTALLELARFYQFDKHLSYKEASNMAVKNLFEASYVNAYSSWSDKFYIPTNVLDGKEIIPLDSKSVNYGLSKLRSDIIKHNVEYDVTSSFGMEYYEGERLESNAIKSVLRSGKFRLSPDKHSVYYVYFDEEGEHPLMKSKDEKITWKLLDLNHTVNQTVAPDDMQDLWHYGVGI